MAGSIDSTAVFKARALAIGISDAGTDAMILAGFDTMAKWAFASSYLPGAANDAPFIAVLTAFLAGPPSAGQLACYRRLFFEAHTTSVSDMRERITRTEDSAPRKLAPPERAARYDAQKARLVGLELDGELEISNSLLDEVMQMLEDDQLQYISLDRCTKRDQESGGVRRDHTLKASIATGDIKVSGSDVLPTADLATDLKIKFALQRRSLAFDQAGIVDFEAFEKWNTLMMSHVMRSAPAGYAQVDINQALRADAMLFKLLGKATRSGIRPSGLGKPVQTAMAAVMYSPEVMFLLMPLPASNRSLPQPVPVPKLAATIPVPKKKPLQGDNPQPTPKKKARKGAGKGKGEKGASLFAEFAGMSTKDDQGVNICLMFNKQAGCTYGKPGGKCGRGRHVCAFPGCLASHGLHEHS